MNTVNRNVVGRPKSAQEIMQSERKLSNSDVIATGVAAVSMLNNKLKKY